jgi:hypothetical protein
MYNSSTSSPEPDSLADLHEQDARHFRAMFLGLADLGVEIAQAVAQRVKDEAYAPAAAPTQLPALVDAYDKLMRSLRRTALLVQKFTAPAPAPRHAGPGGDAGRKPGVRRGGDSLDRDAPVDLSKLTDAELDELDRLDRLEGLEPEDELAGRPLGAVIAEVLRDFGVATLPGVDRYTAPMTADGAAPGAQGAARVVPGQGWTARAWRDDGVEGESMRPYGATGCRDP